ncbi:dDENN domain-containing protein [Aphelenchoides avenae]|nr:dDENN domain-containing protein [Aphelenchus avenae]
MRAFYVPLQTEDLESVLTNAYHIDIPPPGGRLSLNACTWKFSEEVPDPSKLPTLRDDKFMLEFYNAVTEKQMIVLYSSLLKERRIIFTSKKLSQLSSCVFAASRLLYPFHWQNLFIPILPMDLTDMLMAPMPFIIGVPKRTFQGLNKREIGELVVVDLDEKTFESAHNDVLPVDAVAYLKSLLKSPAEMFTSDSLARAFLRTNVFIFGKYRLGFVRKGSTMEVKWDREKFVRDQRQSLQPYLESLIGRDGVQYFERFVDERLDAVNKGLPINDEFEREIALFNQRGFPERTSLLQKDAPEMLHNAVASVRENATDMIGALKDRVQGMSLRNKLGRLTPSELRRHRKGKGKKKRLKPLSVDATVFDWNNPLAPTNTQNGYDEGQARLDDSTSDAESAKSLSESDLIDFSDDTAIENSGSAYSVITLGLNLCTGQSTRH